MANEVHREGKYYCRILLCRYWIESLEGGWSDSVVGSVCTCKYLSCRAAGDSEMVSAASLRACEAFFSPSAAITFALASLAASASAAIALCSCSGSRASFLQRIIRNNIEIEINKAKSLLHAVKPSPSVKHWQTGTIYNVLECSSAIY